MKREARIGWLIVNVLQEKNKNSLYYNNNETSNGAARLRAIRDFRDSSKLAIFYSYKICKQCK